MAQGNPFRPGIGRPPPYLAGRGLIIGEWRTLLESFPTYQPALLLEGRRGVGKTVLLAQLTAESDELGWEPLFLEAIPSYSSTEQLLEAIGDQIQQMQHKLSLVSRAKDLAARARDSVGTPHVSYHEIDLSIQRAGPKDTPKMSTLLEGAASFAISHGRRGIVLAIDELQTIRTGTDSSLAVLFAAIQKANLTEIPIGLMVSGLPGIVSHVGQARTYATHRLFRVEEMSYLSPRAASDAFSIPLRETGIMTDPEVPGLVASYSSGYPYFIQLFGAALYDIAASAQIPTITANMLKIAMPDIQRRLDRDFYKPSVDKLGASLKSLLGDTMACDYPPLRRSDLVTSSGQPARNIDTALFRLVRNGILVSLTVSGEYDYAAPGMRGFLERYFHPDQLTDDNTLTILSPYLPLPVHIPPEHPTRPDGPL